MSALCEQVLLRITVSPPFLDTESQQPNGAEKPGKRQLHKLSWEKRNDKETGSLQIQGESGAGGKTRREHLLRLKVKAKSFSRVRLFVTP